MRDTRVQNIRNDIISDCLTVFNIETHFPTLTVRYLPAQPGEHPLSF